MMSIEPTIEAMKNVPWFANVGLPLTIQTKMQFELVNSWEKALSTRGRNAASNAFLEGVNYLTKETGLHFRNENRLWNRFAAEGREALETEVFPRVDAVIDGNAEIANTSVGADFLKSTIRWDLIHIILEHVYSDLVPPRFYALVFDVYRAGHFPCHWDEVWPNGKLWVY